MKKLKMILGTYSTQPLELSESFYEEAYQKAYRPFLTMAYNFPDVFLTLHYSGPLLIWLELRHPEFITVLREMVARKQIEVLGGGYYEAFLPMIPPSDRVGQIEMLTTWLRKNLGRRFRGCWLAHQVWENPMAYTLKTCGMEYTFLDEERFLEAGISESARFQPVMAEEQGKMLQIFPVCTSLSRSMFSDSPEEFMAKIRKIRDNIPEPAVLSLFVPGEGLCRNAREAFPLCDTVWLGEFFKLLGQGKHEVSTILPGPFNRSPVPLARRHFPGTSFASLEGKKEQGGGNSGYRHILVSRPESNLLYCKMMYTHILTNQVRGDRSRKKISKEELWKGQNHCAYWHGPHEGIYNIKFRHGAYRALIEAEKITREKGIFIPALSSMDFDMDSFNEYLYQGQILNAYCHLRGGVLFELDYLPSSWNYLNTLAPSGALSKAFHDHFLESPDREAYRSGQVREGGDFLERYYDVLLHNREKNILLLAATGFVEESGRRNPVKIRKKYMFKRNSIELEYDITNTSDEGFSCYFGSELNLALPSPATHESRFYRVNISTIEVLQDLGSDDLDMEGMKILQVHDLMNNTTLQVEYSIAPDRFWSFPVEVPACRDEAAALYQGTKFMPLWDMALLPGESRNLGITLKIGKSSGKSFA